MMKIKHLTLMAAAVCCSAASWGAVQGAASRVSSSAIFNNVFGVTLAAGRQVQVTMLKDAIVDNDSPILALNGDAAFHGVSDNFCVIDTSGAAVKIKFQPSVAAGGDWQATNGSTGLTYPYYLTIGLATGSTYQQMVRNATFDIPIGVKSAELCGAGNVTKRLHIRPNLTANTSYIDTVIVVVTPI